jgi:hypothetical protein
MRDDPFYSTSSPYRSNAHSSRVQALTRSQIVIFTSFFHKLSRPAQATTLSANTSTTDGVYLFPCRLVEERTGSVSPTLSTNTHILSMLPREITANHGGLVVPRIRVRMYTRRSRRIWCCSGPRRGITGVKVALGFKNKAQSPRTNESQ